MGFGFLPALEEHFRMCAPSLLSWWMKTIDLVFLPNPGLSRELASMETQMTVASAAKRNALVAQLLARPHGHHQLCLGSLDVVGSGMARREWMGMGAAMLRACLWLSAKESQASSLHPSCDVL